MLVFFPGPRSSVIWFCSQLGTKDSHNFDENYNSSIKRVYLIEQNHLDNIYYYEDKRNYK